VLTMDTVPQRKVMEATGIGGAFLARLATNLVGSRHFH
jgi:hypothetical protein